MGPRLLPLAAVAGATVALAVGACGEDRDAATNTRGGGTGTAGTGATGRTGTSGGRTGTSEGSTVPTPGTDTGG